VIFCNGSIHVLLKPRLCFDLCKKEVAQGKTGFGIARVVNSGNHAPIGDLPSAILQSVALRRKQSSQDSRLKFKAGSVSTRITEIAYTKQRHD
jgi:hypothetical protein